MSMQLILIDESERDWRIDDRTRELGLRGIKAARDVLRAHPRRVDDHPERHAA